MVSAELQVAVDVGSARHRIAIGMSGKSLAEFDIGHNPAGLSEFFTRVREQERRHGATVCVAMEGHGGYARPLDRQVLAEGWRLYAINNLKFARFKEIFPAPAKTDAIDTRRMLQLMQMRDAMPIAQAVLQEVAPIDAVHEELRALTRRRRQLVEERTRVSQRMQLELQSTVPGLLEITGQADNLWFLHFLLCKPDLRQVLKIRRSTLLQIRGIGPKYAECIGQWQRTALMSSAVRWSGPMIQADARRILALRTAIADLEGEIEALTERSSLARRLRSMPGFGEACASELAGEIGNIARFDDEASLAVYLGAAPLSDSSGKRTGAKIPRQINSRARDALLRATVHHMGQVSLSRTFYERKVAQGKTHLQAVRALARHLVRIIFSMLTHDRDYRLPNAEKNS